MAERIKFKDYRRIAHFVNDVTILRGITKKQSSILAKLRPKGRSKPQKLSSFGQKLQSKRLFSVLYGKLSYKEYSLLFQEACKYPGKIGINFLSLVEKRLDVVVFRIFFFKSLNSARQCINHQGVLVNGRIVDLSSYKLTMGDIIQIRKPLYLSDGSFLPNLSKDSEISPTLLTKFPHYEVNYKILSGIFLFSPQQLYYPLQVSLTELIPGIKR